MRDDVVLVLRVARRGIRLAGLALLGLALLAGLSYPLLAQKVQEGYRDKLDIVGETGGVAIAASADGRYVYVAGEKGILVSDDFGRTGSWVQTVRLR